jgi:hypothetical protein
MVRCRAITPTQPGTPGKERGMSDQFLGDRERALEEEFFRRREAALRERDRAEAARKGVKAAMSAASGVSDDATLQRFLDLKMQPDTVMALRLVPVVEVAWADGSVDDRERQAVLEGVASIGITPDSVAYALVEGWLAEPPAPSLHDAWASYARALAAQLSPTDRADLRRGLVKQARAVAEAAGGFLGLGSKVSKAEEEVLRRLEAAFAD